MNRNKIVENEDRHVAASAARRDGRRPAPGNLCDIDCVRSTDMESNAS